ncbi:MAG: class I SAM-dependent methyltransferase [Alphaproteobacteria bacterium]|nr:class I SAM-dependent methyltransferase [Alphaproteobacteria bacterium]
MRQEPADDTDFGFARVTRAEKARRVRQVFDSVARRYDVMNDLMSGGLHRLWKGALIDWLRPRPGMRILDCACGTGDVALRLAPLVGRAGSVVALDINASMLARGTARPHGGRVDWLVGDAQRLPFADRSFDAYTIAFGIRNCSDLDAVLAEALRVLRPGGRFLCLEFSRLELPHLAALYDRYSLRFVPWLGQQVAKDGAAYRYLVESIRRFPGRQAFAARIAAAGLAQVAHRDLAGGIAALHSAWRI